MKKINIGDRVITPHGDGIVAGMDLPNSNVPRIKVKLDNNVFKYEQACYFVKEIKLIK